MSQMMQDVRYALRQMRKSPGFALIAVLTLGLGVGAATAVFSVIDAAMLRPLPFSHPEQIVLTETRAQAGYTQPFSYPSYKDLKHRFSGFSAFAGFSGKSLNMEGPSGPVSLRAVRVTDSFFNVFEVKPMLGRTFVDGEDEPGRDNVVVLSYEVWQTNFAGDKAAVGKTIRLDGSPYVVIGVMPAGFRYPMSGRSAVYTPIHARETGYAEQRGSHWMRTIARLKDGTTAAQAQAEFTAGLSELGKRYPDTDAGRTGHLVDLNSAVLGKTGGTLWMLVGAVLALLAIACVNVAGLLLARAVKREREIAMRAAVGASRMRLLQQMVTESLLLAGLSSVLGIALAYVLLAAMRAYLITALARGADVKVNGFVLVAAVLFASLTAVLASLVPAIRLSGVDPNRMLKSGGASGAGRGQNRLRSSFIAAQVMLSLTLLIVAGLLLQTLSRARATKLGFDPDRIMAMDIELSPGNYAGKDVLVGFWSPLVERVKAIHGVNGAGLISILPIESYGSNSDVHIAGQAPYPKDQVMLAEVRLVSQGYFDAMGIQLRDGRMLSPGLDPSTAKAGTVVVNEAFKRKFFSGGGDAVGARIDDADKPEEKTNIVGMMTDIRQSLMEPPMAEMDFLINEMSIKAQASSLMSMSLVVRSEGDPRVLIPELRSVLHDVDASVPFHQPEMMTEVVADQLVMERMESWLFGVFAVIAVTLALVGLYGLISHEVEIGARDIGVRMALGATRGLVMRMVLGRVLLLIGIGAGLGLGLTLGLKKAIGSVVEMEYGRDGWSMLGVAVALIGMGALAAFFPAKRAASIEPMEALRSE
jgi:putative ABC transport system permease protein